ncbi:hypothetical protein [Clostridioides sp. ZZV14-6105]|uniref:hypothetical protein n=1 Tax=Clostridioides sp. ZZV14-6105 TaxID=2811492 RepID=UPI0039B89406
MANVLQYVTLFQQELDSQIVVGSTTGWMKRNSGQTTGDFKEGPKALDINWLITPSSAPIAISKTDKPRIFTPDQNQSADAYKIDYRKYHDLWLLDEPIKLCRACVKQAKATQE